MVANKLDRRSKAFSDGELKRLREAHADGVSLVELARRFNVSHGWISRLVRQPTSEPSAARPEIRSAQSARQWLGSRLGLSAEQVTQALELPAFSGPSSALGQPHDGRTDLEARSGAIRNTFEAWSRLLVAAGRGAVLPTPKEALLTSIALGWESIVSNGDYERALNQWTKRRGRRRRA